MNKFLLPCFCMFLFFTCCEKNLDVQPETESSTASATTIATCLNADLLLKLVNEKRSSGCNCGTTVMLPVATLKWNNFLAAAALAHSKDMNANNYFSHTSLDSRSAGRQNYRCRI